MIDRLLDAIEGVYYFTTCFAVMMILAGNGELGINAQVGHAELGYHLNESLQ